MQKKGNMNLRKIIEKKRLKIIVKDFRFGFSS